MLKRLEMEIFGRVQMVLFRDYTRRNAKRLNLSGIVMNTENGSVKVIAEGEERDLEIFLNKMKIGSPLAKVNKIEHKWLSETGEFPDFRIVYRSLLDRI